MYWMIRDLYRFEIWTSIQRILRLPEVNVPHRRVRVAVWPRGCAAVIGITTVVVERDIRVQAAVRLVVNDVHLSRATRNHPGKHGRVARLLGQVDRRRRSTLE